MSGSFSTFGYRNLTMDFGREANEIIREFYVDSISGVIGLMDLLLGTPDGQVPTNTYAPHQFPNPMPNQFDKFYCDDVKIAPIKEGAIQGSQYLASSETNLTTWISTLENNSGGFVVQAIYRPMQVSVLGEGYIIEEGFDFSGQVMSLISNAWAQDPAHAMQWEVSGPASNLKGMTKIIPKIELMQKTINLAFLPGDSATSLIGSVNKAPFRLMSSDVNGGIKTWPAETLLLLGMPTLRRWRWDGRPSWECTLRIAANTYQDYIVEEETQVIDYVTWNRLYNIYSDNGPCWERLYLCPKLNDDGTIIPPLSGGQGPGQPMYQPLDWSPLYSFGAP